MAVNVARPRRAAAILGALMQRTGPAPRLDPVVLDRVGQALSAAVAAGQLPGAVVRIERHPHIGQGDPPAAVFEHAVGLKALEPVPEPLAVDTVYDAASLTKVVVTAPLVLRLEAQGALDIEAPVRWLLPDFAGPPGITVRHLLTHTSGLPAGLPLEADWAGPEAALALACRRDPTHAPGTFFRYSDVNFILLGEIVQRLAGQPLDALAQAWLFGPLGMRDSGFRRLGAPASIPPERIAPTEWTPEAAAGRPRLLRGEVHDPTARRMGGVAGHAGLFSTAADIARYARMVLGGGQLDGVRVLEEATVARMTAVATPPAMAERRSLGWDIDSPFARARGLRYPVGSFGHTGFTGCALWIDPASRSFSLLLSNRVHPRAVESIVALYEQVATLAAEAAA